MANYAVVLFQDNTITITEKKRVIKRNNELVIRCGRKGSYIGKLITIGSEQKCLEILAGLRTTYMKGKQILLNPIILLHDNIILGLDTNCATFPQIKHSSSLAPQSQDTFDNNPESTESAASSVVYTTIIKNTQISSPNLHCGGRISSSQCATSDNTCNIVEKCDNQVSTTSGNESTILEQVYLTTTSATQQMNSPELLFFDGDSSSTWNPSENDSSTPMSVTSSEHNITKFVTPPKSKKTAHYKKFPVRKLSFDLVGPPSSCLTHVSHETSYESQCKLSSTPGFNSHTRNAPKDTEVGHKKIAMEFTTPTNSRAVNKLNVVPALSPRLRTCISPLKSPQNLFHNPSIPGTSSTKSSKSSHVVASAILPTTDTVKVDDSSVPKLYYCNFCNKQVRRYGRHITTVHKQLPQIKDIIALPVFSFERALKISELRKAAQFEFNQNSEDNKKLFVTYRTSSKYPKAAKDYIPCPNCKSYYRHSTLFLHYKRCTQEKCAKGIKQLGRMLTEKRFPEYLDQLKKVLSKARQDNITEIIRQDESILLFGARLCSKFKFQPHLDSLIRYQLRLLAKLLQTMKTLDSSISCLLDCFKIDQWKNIISAVMKFCKYNSERRHFESPASAMHLGTVLQNCCTSLISHYIQIHCDVIKGEIENFKSLVRTEYREAVTRVCMTNLANNRRNKCKSVPLTEDIVKLNKYVKEQADKAFHILQNKFSYFSWYNLACFTMTYILLFNRRRTGETERLLVDNYNAKQKIQKDSDTYKTLSESEKVLSEKFHRMEIRGKWERNVPVLLTDIMIQYIDTLLKFRNNAKVSPNNPYIFGLPASPNSHLSATKVLREASTKCEAINPLTLRGTSLRKQIATLTQVMNLNDNDISLLANYMGHSKLIHQEHYKTTDSTMQIARLSKLLLLFNNGDLHQYRSYSLEDLDNIDMSGLVSHSNDIFGQQSIQNKSKKYRIPEDTGVGTKKIAKEFTTPKKSFKISSRPVNKLNMVPTLSPRLTARITQKSPHKSPHISTPGRQRIFSKKRCWSHDEKRVVLSIFGDYIKKFRVPSRILCQDACEKYPVLKNRNGTLLYAYICNLIKNRKK